MLPSELWNYAKVSGGGVELSLPEYGILITLIKTINAQFREPEMFALIQLSDTKYYIYPGGHCKCKNCMRALELLKKLDAEVSHATK